MYKKLMKNQGGCMKIHKSTHQVVTAAENDGIGTTWYRVTREQFRDFIENREDNLFVQYTANTNGFESLNLTQMFGSAIYDEELFICVSDGQPITVGQDADVDPETAFEKYTPEELEVYIKDAKDTELTKYITYREFKPELLEEAQTNAAIEALQSGDYTLDDVIKDYNKLW